MLTSILRAEDYPIKLGKQLTRSEQAEHLDAIIEKLKPILSKAIKYTVLETYDTAHGGPRAESHKRFDYWDPAVTVGTSGYSGSTKWTRLGVHSVPEELPFTKQINGEDVAFKTYSILAYGLTKECEWLMAECEFEDTLNGPLFHGKDLCLNCISLSRPENTEHLLDWAKTDIDTIMSCLLLPCLQGEETRLKRRAEEMSAGVEYTLRCSSILRGFH